MPRLQARLLRYSQTLEMLWGSLGVALGWLWGSLGVALGWLWGAYAVPINRPWGGLGVALGGFAQPPFWFQLSAFSISPFAQLWLWGGLPAQSRITNHLRLQVALPGCSRFEVQSSVFSISLSNTNSPPAPPSGWSRGTLVPPWTCPIPIDPA